MQMRVMDRQNTGNKNPQNKTGGTTNAARNVNDVATEELLQAGVDAIHIAEINKKLILIEVAASVHGGGKHSDVKASKQTTSKVKHGKRCLDENNQEEEEDKDYNDSDYTKDPHDCGFFPYLWEDDPYF